MKATVLKVEHIERETGVFVIATLQLQDGRIISMCPDTILLPDTIEVEETEYPLGTYYKQVDEELEGFD